MSFDNLDDEEAELEAHRRRFLSAVRQFTEAPGESLPSPKSVYRRAGHWYLRAADRQLQRCIGRGLEQFPIAETFVLPPPSPGPSS